MLEKGPIKNSALYGEIPNVIKQAAGWDGDPAGFDIEESLNKSTLKKVFYIARLQYN